MAAADSAFLGSIPELYERLLVPLIFAEPARHLAAAVLANNPADILETAAGTGVLTRALTEHDGPHVTATDLNEPMLVAAAERGTNHRVGWQVADALELPYPDQSFDAVVCQFGVMFFPDRPTGYAEARRVLRHGGRFMFNTWDRLEANPAWYVISEALNAASPRTPIEFLRRTPYSYFEPDQIRSELQTAGYPTITIESLTGTSRAGAADIATAVCRGTPLQGELNRHPVLDLDRAIAVATTALRTEFGEDPICAPTGWLQVCASA